MFVVVVTFDVRPDGIDAFRRAVRRQAETSLAREAGCLRFDVAVADDDPACILLYEIYRDRDAFDDHLKTAHFAAFDAEVAPLVRAKQVGTYALLADDAAS